MRWPLRSTCSRALSYHAALRGRRRRRGFAPRSRTSSRSASAGPTGGGARRRREKWRLGPHLAASLFAQALGELGDLTRRSGGARDRVRAARRIATCTSQMPCGPQRAARSPARPANLSRIKAEYADDTRRGRRPLALARPGPAARRHVARRRLPAARMPLVAPSPARSSERTAPSTSTGREMSTHEDTRGPATPRCRLTSGRAQGPSKGRSAPSIAKTGALDAGCPQTG